MPRVKTTRTVKIALWALRLYLLLLLSLIVLKFTRVFLKTDTAAPATKARVQRSAAGDSARGAASERN